MRHEETVVADAHAAETLCRLLSRWCDMNNLFLAQETLTVVAFNYDVVVFMAECDSMSPLLIESLLSNL